MQDLDANTDVKDELRLLHDEITIELIKTREHLDRVEHNLKIQMSMESSKIIKAIKDFAALCLKVKREQIITCYRLNGLERRVKTLEMQ